MYDGVSGPSQVKKNGTEVWGNIQRKPEFLTLKMKVVHLQEKTRILPEIIKS